MNVYHPDSVTLEHTADMNNVPRYVANAIHNELTHDVTVPDYPNFPVHIDPDAEGVSI